MMPDAMADHMSVKLTARPVSAYSLESRSEMRSMMAWMSFVAARRRRCASTDPDCTVACRDAKAILELLGLVDGPSRVAVAEHDVVVLQVVDVQLVGVDEHDGPVLLV